MKKWILGGSAGLGIAAVLFACASTGPTKPAATNLDVPTVEAGLAAVDSGSPEPPEDYADDAPGRYARAMDLLKRGRATDASAAFDDVRTRFKYSKYATFAELRIADIAFDKEDYLNATHLYLTWLHDHPSYADKEMVFARSQLASCRANGGSCGADPYDAGL